MVNYLDHDTSGSPSDLHCSWQSYHAHKGSDFVLRDFRQMDSGVAVIATAKGIVTFVLDTLFDRSKQGDTGGFGNYVRIDHGDGFSVDYAHIRKHSAHVKVGDSVQRGQVLAFVGSSGRSSDPHLHLEVYKRGALVDPFGDACRGTGATTLFDAPPTYDSSFFMISGGLLSTVPTLDSLREHPAEQMVFTPTKDSTIGMWVHGLTLKRGDSARVDWLAPDGSVWYEYSSVNDTNIRYWYWWSYIDGPARQSAMPSGAWSVKWYHNGELSPSFVRTFQVVGTALVLPREELRSLPFSPNPAHDRITLHCANVDELVLIDPLGRQVRPHWEYESSARESVDLSTLPSGTFLLRVHGSEGWSSAHVVIAR